MSIDSTTDTPEPAPAPPDDDPAASSPPQAPDADTTRRVRRTALLAILSYLAFDLLVPLIPYHTKMLPFGFELVLRRLVFWVGPTAIFMLLQLWLARSFVALRWPPKVCLGYLGLAVVLWIGTFAAGASARHFGSVIGPLVFENVPVFAGLFLTLGLTSLGVLMSRIVREPNVLLPVALVAMPIDYIGAMTNVGFTNTVVKQHPDVVSSVSVHVPHVSGLPLVALIGPGDALFIAFFFAAVQRFDLNMRGTFWWMFWLLTAAMTEVILIGFPVAALVPMGIAVIAANRRYFHLKREEVFAVLYAALLIFAIVGVFYYFSHRALMHR